VVIILLAAILDHHFVCLDNNGRYMHVHVFHYVLTSVETILSWMKSCKLAADKRDKHKALLKELATQEEADESYW
jgi:hypothetical protein